MLREFEIFSKPSFPTVALKRGFSWPGFFFTWIWALGRGLWVQAAVIFGLGFAIIELPILLHVIDLPMNVLVGVVVGTTISMTVGVKGNEWKCRKLERDGYQFVALVEARSPAQAVAAHALGKGRSVVRTSAAGTFVGPPNWAQGVIAITQLTWKAAVRFRLFLVIAVLLLAAVVGLPILIKDDGTAQGFTQIVLTYTLGAVTALLGLCTLWLSCGTLARDIEECQMQIVATKPIARWQIWLGKWLGIVLLNAALLAIAGACVYGLMQWRAKSLPPKEQEALRSQVLVARGSAKPDDVQAKIEAEARENLKERLNKVHVSDADLPEVQRQILEQVKYKFQIVPPGYFKTWEIHLGSRGKSLRDKPLQLRIKFETANYTTSGTYAGLWHVGVPQKTKLWQNEEPMSLAPGTFHEFQIPAGLIDDDGVLTISFANLNDTVLLFPIEDSMEVLYPEGGFGLNFVRGLGIILCWMALLAAIGLASASFLSFPVAAFLCVGVLTLVFSSGTMAGVVADGTINNNSGASDTIFVSVLNTVIVPAFAGIVKVINFAAGFSPIDALSTGRAISWADLGLAFVQIVLLFGGVVALIGMFIFTRRELATAQSQ